MAGDGSPYPSIDGIFRTVDEILSDSKREQEAWEQYQMAKKARSDAEQAFRDAKAVCAYARKIWRLTLTPEAQAIAGEDT